MNDYPYQAGDFIVLGPETFSDTDKTVICHKGENYYAPKGERLAEWEKAALAIDPADVMVGDIVEIEGDDWMVRGKVTATNHNTPYPTTMPLTLACPTATTPSLRDATVRLVRRAEPEPDPEQVKALVRIIGEVDLESVRLHEEIAADLVRRGVRVQPEEQS